MIAEQERKGPRKPREPLCTINLSVIHAAAAYEAAEFDGETNRS